MASSVKDGKEYKCEYSEYNFVHDLPDRVICKICHNPCRNAHLTRCCGSHFCYSCLQQLKKGTAVNKACPICREEKFKIFPNKQLDREIKELLVYCTNRSSGCTWSGEMNNMEKHINSDCPLPCPYGCKLNIAPSVGIRHKKECLLQLVQCDYHDIGCKILLCRRELNDHYKEKVPEHLSLIKSSLTGVIENIDKTEKKLCTMEQRLENALDCTKRNYDKLRIEIKTMEDRVAKIAAKSAHINRQDTGMFLSGHVRDYIGIYSYVVMHMYVYLCVCSLQHA